MLQKSRPNGERPDVLSTFEVNNIDDLTEAIELLRSGRQIASLSFSDPKLLMLVPEDPTSEQIEKLYRDAYLIIRIRGAVGDVLFEDLTRSTDLMGGLQNSIEPWPIALNILSLVKSNDGALRLGELRKMVDDYLTVDLKAVGDLLDALAQERLVHLQKRPMREPSYSITSRGCRVFEEMSRDHSFSADDMVKRDILSALYNLEPGQRFTVKRIVRLINGRDQVIRILDQLLMDDQLPMHQIDSLISIGLIRMASSMSGDSAIVLTEDGEQYYRSHSQVELDLD